MHSHAVPQISLKISHKKKIKKCFSNIPRTLKIWSLVELFIENIGSYLKDFIQFLPIKGLILEVYKEMKCTFFIFQYSTTKNWLKFGVNFTFHSMQEIEFMWFVQSLAFYVRCVRLLKRLSRLYKKVFQSESKRLLLCVMQRFNPFGDAGNENETAVLIKWFNLIRNIGVFSVLFCFWLHRRNLNEAMEQPKNSNCLLV